MSNSGQSRCTPHSECLGVSGTHRTQRAVIQKVAVTQVNTAGGARWLSSGDDTAGHHRGIGVTDMELPGGIEPPTYSLRVNCSTD